jgi:hypothetical protein
MVQGVGDHDRFGLSEKDVFQSRSIHIMGIKELIAKYQNRSGLDERELPWSENRRFISPYTFFIISSATILQVVIPISYMQPIIFPLAICCQFE